MKFKQLNGFHTENGIKSKKGDIVESNKNLAKTFSWRFQKITKIDDKKIVEPIKEFIEKDVINIAPEAEKKIIPETDDSKPFEKKQSKKVKSKRKSKKAK